MIVPEVTKERLTGRGTKGKMTTCPYARFNPIQLTSNNKERIVE